MFELTDINQEDIDFFVEAMETLGFENLANLFRPIDILEYHLDVRDDGAMKVLALFKEYKQKLLKEKEYQDLQDKTIYNPPGQLWAAPLHQQEDLWLLRFHDKDCGEAIFRGEDAEKQAWKAWNRYSPSFNINLFRLAQIPKPE